MNQSTLSTPQETAEVHSTIQQQCSSFDSWAKHTQFRFNVKFYSFTPKKNNPQQSKTQAEMPKTDLEEKKDEIKN